MDDDRLLAVLAGDGSRTHGERLPGEIARALEQAAVTRDRIDLLAVATGPGAFTGLRIGLAAIQGLAMTLDKPVIGVSALDALAEQIIASDADAARPMDGCAAWRCVCDGDRSAIPIDGRDARGRKPTGPARDMASAPRESPGDLHRRRGVT
jgi:tRNA threonylcarbamoyl adenosine modification protein YeaZ